MKYLLTFVSLAIGASTLYGQTIYKSSNESYRTQYYLAFKDEIVTLYAWETLEEDTIYFKASGHLDTTTFVNDGIVRKNVSVKFENYKFTAIPPTESKLNYFFPDKDDLLPTVLLHKYLHISETDGTTMKAIMVKDVYDGRFDEFTFTEIE